MEAKELWGMHVVAIRKQFNLSQEELANRIGTNQATISRWERNLSKPTYRLQKLIASLYGEPPDSRELKLEVIYEIAQRFVESQNIVAMLYDRELILRAFNTYSNRAVIGKHMADAALPWEKDLVAPLADLLESISFWDQPGKEWIYHNPLPPNPPYAKPPHGIPFMSVRIILRSINISGEPFMLLSPKCRVEKSGSGEIIKEYCEPEPFAPRPGELHLPIELIVDSLMRYRSS